MMYGLMTFLVIAWGLDYVVAKQALESMDSLTLMFFKYAVGFLVVLVLKLKLDPTPIRKKDVLLFLACAIVGDIGYFFFEYNAMDYLPISLITLILSFVPVISLLAERAIYHRKITRRMAIGVIVCTLGVGLVIGADLQQMLTGRLLGYLLAFGAVISWNAYNFITASMQDRYSSINVSFYQIAFTITLLFPYAVTHLPSPEQVTSQVVWGVVYLGVISAGIGFYIQVKSIHIIGVTPASMFSNFMPVTSTFFGWLILGEWISTLQIIGGIVIIVSGAVVIREKERPVPETAEENDIKREDRIGQP